MPLAQLPYIQVKQLVTPNVVALPVGIHFGPPPGPPLVIPLTISWSQYRTNTSIPYIAVKFDLSAGVGPGIVFDKVRSIKIDNSFSAIPVYVKFDDTLDTIACPPFAILVTPVFTNLSSGTIIGTRFSPQRVPTTIVTFFNFAQQGLLVQGLEGNPVRISPLGSFNIIAASTAQNIPSIAFTFAPDASRMVAVAVYSRGNAAGARNLLSGSFGATLATVSNGFPGGFLLTPPGIVNTVQGLMYASMPLGAATGIINAQFDNTMAGVSGMAWEITNVSNPVAVFGSSLNFGASGGRLLRTFGSAEIVPGGRVIAAMSFNDAAGNVAQWNADNMSLSASQYYTDGGSYSITGALGVFDAFQDNAAIGTSPGNYLQTMTFV